MEKMMKKENVWDQKTEIGMVEGSVEEVFLEEITYTMKKMKLRKVYGLSKVSMEMINASGKVGIDVMMKLVQRVLDGKGDVINCKAYRGVKLLEHGIKIIEMLLEKRIRTLVAVDDMQFGFLQEDEQQMLIL